MSSGYEQMGGPPDSLSLSEPSAPLCRVKAGIKILCS